MRARDALARADIAVAVFDASTGLRAQDMHIIGMAMDANTGLVVCANKWDLIADKLDKQHFVRRIKRPPALRDLGAGGGGVGAGAQRSRRVAARGAGGGRGAGTPRLDGELNALPAARDGAAAGADVGPAALEAAVRHAAGGGAADIRVFRQRSHDYGASYRRYLENSLRAAFGFRGAGIRLIFRSRGEE